MPQTRIRRKTAAALSVAVLGALNGCVGGGAPDDPYALPGRQTEIVAAAGSSTTGDPPPPAGSKQSHFPLVDGASWTYQHTSVVEDAWEEKATVTATTYKGQDAFVLADEEDAEGEQTRSTLTIDGTGVYRSYKETAVADQVAVTTVYDPAFMRYDEAWITPGQTVTLDDDWTETCVIASAASKCAPGAVKMGVTVHTYTVLDIAAKISVPAGDFTTVKIQRDNVLDPETKLFWFALGVGKVREENPESGAVEALSAYEIP